MIGALQVQNYALFVSHKHPDGHVRVFVDDILSNSHFSFFSLGSF